MTGRAVVDLWGALIVEVDEDMHVRCLLLTKAISHQSWLSSVVGPPFHPPCSLQSLHILVYCDECIRKVGHLLWLRYTKWAGFGHAGQSRMGSILVTRQVSHIDGKNSLVNDVFQLHNYWWYQILIRLNAAKRRHFHEAICLECQEEKMGGCVTHSQPQCYSSSSGSDLSCCLPHCDIQEHISELP